MLRESEKVLTKPIRQKAGSREHSSDEVERRRLLVEWNRTQTEFPRTRCVHELFEEQARSRRKAAALTCGAELLTYEAVNARANRLAHHLVARGVTPGTRVGLCLDRSLELVVSILAVLKAGGAYAPLGSRSPSDRLTSMLDDLEVPVVLTHQRFRQRLALALTRTTKAASARVICLDADEQSIGGESERNLRIPSRAEAVAYISFTSGSTGRPKGVCVPHRGIVRLVKNTNYACFGPSEVLLQNAPVSFDASLFEIWGSLLNGGHLVLTPSQLPTLSELAHLIHTHGITTAWFTTGLFNQLVDELPEALGSLKQVLTGGDVASPFHIKKALKFIRQGVLINGYGPTENSTFSTTYTIPPDYDGTRAVPIGRPVSNTVCYILNHDLEPVPVGSAGELYVGGDGLATGYLNRPQRTAERFIPNPFGQGTRLYRTGDQARYLPDGNIEFLGRIDQQVKIRGFRVEPGDIESKLLQHPAVRQCVVTARPGASGLKQLVAYLVTDDTSASAAPRWQALLRRQLPDYMVPACFIRIERLPLNPNGKVDYNALPAPERNRLRQNKRTEPSDGLERKLKEIWETVLKVEPISLKDNFFALGGHSLLAMRIVATIEKQLGRRISVPTVFENPTIAELAEVLGQFEQKTEGSAIIKLQPHGNRPPLVLVHGAGGGMFWGYANLARHLGEDQPVLAFKSRGLEGLPEPESIAGLAALYADELCRLQPQGPYYLGGYCFGGLVAYEMARRLTQSGQRIQFLALINTSVPNSSYSRFQWAPSSAWRFAKNLLLKSAYACIANQWSKLLRWRGRLLIQRLQSRKQNGAEASAKADQWADLSSYSHQEQRLWQMHIRAWTSYQPQPYNGPVTLFRSNVHQLYSSFDESYGWKEFVQGAVAVHRIWGGHDTIMAEPYVKHLGAAMRTALQRAQDRRPRATE